MFLQRIVGIGLCLFIVFSFCVIAATNAENLVDKFKSLTDIQQDAYRKKIENNIEIYAGGVVDDVRETTIFDTIGEGYYKVITKPKKTSRQNSYINVFCFKDKNKAMDYNKGKRIVPGKGKLLVIKQGMFGVEVWILVDN